MGAHMIGINTHRRAKRTLLSSASLAIAIIFFASFNLSSAAFGAGAAAESFVANVEGQPWTASRMFASASEFGAKPVLSITAFLDTKPLSHFTFNIFVAGADHFVGSFVFGKGSALSATHGSFFASTGAEANPLEDNYSFADGTISIDSYDAAAHSVSGTFSGNAKNHVGKMLKISDGRFSGVVIVAAEKP